ncbi:MAG TPA: hypothetical protein VFV38_34335, partial [Ktedonobacteraceae bacterium]|nr:hypothetical protein [Ktedonobacteraceae bacterium]
MNDNTRQPAIQDRFAGVFKRLRDQDIEQFYANYQLWVMRQRVPILEQEIATLRTHLAEHQQQIQALRPSAIALAVLARLQSNGVRDVILLDQMLERGEDWLDRMMQRLDYCEQVEDFIQGDYTQWCVNSLDGAYDWIDSLRGSPEEENTDSSTADAPDEAEAQATAELLLQRLSTDDEETFQNSSLRPSQAETETAAAPGVENVESPTPTSGEIAHVEASSVEAELSTLETVQTASPASESTGEQVTPWYALPLTEDESFDFEHPASMHDWIKILQADSPATPETTETAEPEAAGAESLFHPVSNAHTEDTPYPEEAPIYQDALEAREEISFDSEYQPSETEAVESNELASIPTQDIEEARGQEELPGVPETKAELDTEELAPTMPEPAEIASGQDAAEIADELTTHEQAE